MKFKVLFFLLTGSLLAMTAWLAHGPSPVQADEVPEKYRDTVHKGLEYLARNQFKDGHWEGAGGQHPVAMTGLCGVALLMEGSNVHKGKYTANLLKAVDWLIDKSQGGRDGLIFSGHASETDRYMYGHGLATLFLAWAYGNEIDRERRQKIIVILNRAVKYIVNAQSTQGGWYPTSRVEGHDFDEISATAFQIQALYLAGNLGIPVPTEVVKDAQEYLKTSLAKQERTKTGPNRGPAETAAALACRSSPDVGYENDEWSNKWFKYCRGAIELGPGIQFGRDEMTHYFYAQAVYNHALNAQREFVVKWSDYQTATFDHLQKTQNKDGSWPTPLASQGSIGVGPIYATAVWCTVLQFDTRNHPLTRQRQLAIF